MNTDWFSEEAFWERFAPVVFDEDRWSEVPAVADGIERLTGVSASDRPRALDLCCGTGRITVELALRGYRMTGVDFQKTYLAAARESAEDEGVEVELIHADVRGFSRPSYYDLGMVLYFSLGYFPDPGDDLVFLRNARASLRDGASFVVESIGKELAARDFLPAEDFERGGFQVHTEVQPIDGWASLRNAWTITRGSERFERTFEQRLYSGAELRRLLMEAGFGRVDLYGEWDGAPYDHRARVLIAVARTS